MTSIDPKTLKRWLHDGGEIALLDVREHGQYGESHLFYGVPLPFSRLELDAPRLLPRIMLSNDLPLLHLRPRSSAPRSRPRRAKRRANWSAARARGRGGNP